MQLQGCQSWFQCSTSSCDSSKECCVADLLIVFAEMPSWLDLDLVNELDSDEVTAATHCSVPAPMATTASAGAGKKTVSCMLAIDGGDRLGKQWPALCNGYLPAIIKCVATGYRCLFWRLS